MNTAQSTVLSHANNEVSPAKPDRNESGVHYWRVVEIRGERWFQIESCTHSSGEAAIKTFIFKDFSNAMALLHKLRDSTWISLRLYTRAPLLRPAGFVFEEIENVFELKDGTLLFSLESGTVFSERKLGMLGIRGPEPLQDAKEIYSSIRHGT